MTDSDRPPSDDSPLPDADDPLGAWLAAHSSRNRPLKSWLALGLVMIGIVVFFLLYFLPLLAERNRLAQAVEQSHQEGLRLRQQLSGLKTQVAKFHDERDRFAAKLSMEVAEKRAVEQALAAAEKQLASSLENEMAKGDISLSQRGGELVLDVSDRLLFPPGAAEVSEQGKKVLFEVAKTLHRLPNRRVRVGGHTDSTRVVSADLRERFPTNWELSTARATNVVRYLQETGGVSGKRLIAAGFSHFQPAASNRTEAGRERNRRIELVLLRPERVGQ